MIIFLNYISNDNFSTTKLTQKEWMYSSFDLAEDDFMLLIDTYLEKADIDKDDFKDLEGRSYQDLFYDHECKIPLYKNDPTGEKGYIKVLLNSVSDGNVEMWEANYLMERKERSDVDV